MNKYEAVIGLEVHVQLSTKSKLFCSCSTKFGSAPNTNVCEICCGMPGSLPSPNHEAINLGIMAGIAAHCKINRKSVFSRKNYFYPDLPAGYQISQFDLPICEKGFLIIKKNGKEKKIGITRIHLENDAGKSLHLADENVSCVDLNRAGTPLIEIVSEPDLRSPAEAAAYLKQLHELVTYLGISDGNMEEGNFRCDANISLRPRGETSLGTRTELKNLNSFRNVQKALEYEIYRQSGILDDAGEVTQETRLFNPDKNITIPMRGKEEAQDYRYFPDPDLAPVEISEERLEKLQKSMPEAPATRKERFIKMTGLPEAEIEMLLHSARLADYFEATARLADPHKAASLILGSVLKECAEKNMAPDPLEWKMSPEKLAIIAQMAEKNEISAKVANDLAAVMLNSDEDIAQYIAARGLSQISDASLLERAVIETLNQFPEEREAYKNGKNKLLSFFMGQIMRKTRGKANPALAAEILNKKIGR